MYAELFRNTITNGKSQTPLLSDFISESGRLYTGYEFHVINTALPWNTHIGVDMPAVDFNQQHSVADFDLNLLNSFGTPIY